MTLRFARLLVAVFALSLALGCGEDPVFLSIDLKTDYLPGVEFTTVETDLSSPTVASDRTSARTADDYIGGERVAEFSAMPGRFEATVRLLDRRGSPIAERHAVITARVDLGLTLIITRSCEGMTCPADGDELAATECEGGRCIDPTCTSETPELCPEGCTSAAECPSGVACATALCDRGACLTVADDRLCDAGLMCHPVDGCVAIDEVPDASRPDGGPADTSVGSDAGSCACRDPAAECDGTCVLSGVTCGALVLCPAEYECDAGQCRCRDFLSCGRLCGADEDCAGLAPPLGIGRHCDTVNGVCREARRCLDPAVCLDGEACVTGVTRAASLTTTCQVAGPGFEGETCSSGGDCVSGVCAGVCLERCLRSSDCGPGLSCGNAATYFGVALSCDAVSTCGCAASEACVSASCASPCWRDDDCASGDCSVARLTPLSGSGTGTCTSGVARCRGDESLLNDTFCLRPRSCWGDEHCTMEPGTTCIWEDDDPDLRRRDGSGFCGYPAP